MSASDAREPKVSVLMAAYNAEKFVGEALDDLLTQTFTEFELVVVEDGSTDGTLAVLESYAARDPRVVVVRNERNLGLPASLNKGLERCRAALVARADADDRYAPDRLERQIRFMEEHPDVGLLSCAVNRIDEEGNYLNTSYIPTEDGEIRLHELFLNCFSHPGVMFRKHLVQAVGGYDPAYRSGQDADLWARLRPHTRAANLNVPLVHYRMHSASLMKSRGKKEHDRALSVRQRLLSDYLRRPVSMEEIGAAQAVWMGKAAPEDLYAGLRSLREVLRAARKREDAATVRYFRSKVAGELMKHAGMNRHDPRLRWKLLAKALWWSPRWLLVRLRTKLGFPADAAVRKSGADVLADQRRRVAAQASRPL